MSREFKKITIFLVLLTVFLLPGVVKAEPVVIDKVEIINANLSIKIGEEPTFTAELKDYANQIKLEETFYSLNRASYASSGQSYGEDKTIKNYDYYHIIDLEITDDENIIFDQNTKAYINGVEKTISYVSEGGTLMVIANEDEKIYPEGYVAPNDLDETFKEELFEKLEKEILEQMKNGKVTYKDEQDEEYIQYALDNDIPIYFDFYISKSESLTNRYDEDEISSITGKVEEGETLAGFYDVEIGLWIDGDYRGCIHELEDEIEVTVPTPNGLKELQKGYKRVWVIINYHDGVSERIEAEETENGIAFKVGKLSAFGSVYYDVVDESYTEESEVQNPATGDFTLIYTAVIVMALVTLLGIKIKNN